MMQDRKESQRPYQSNTWKLTTDWNDFRLTLRIRQLWDYGLVWIPKWWQLNVLLDAQCHPRVLCCLVQKGLEGVL